MSDDSKPVTETTNRGPAPTARIPVADYTMQPRAWFWKGDRIDRRKAKRITRKVWATYKQIGGNNDLPF